MHLPYPGPSFSRRTLLQASALAGLGQARLMAGVDVPTLARAKACIFIFLWGGPSHIDTLDPKPEAPDTVRSPFQTIATRTPGLFISELLPGLADRSDKLAIIRSLNHTDPAHLSSAHVVTTGHLAPVVRSDADPPSDRDTPHLGSMVTALHQHRLLAAPQADSVLPSFVTLPWLTYHPAAPGGRSPGQHGGWLGHSYDPLLIEGDLSQAGWEVPALRLQENVSANRLDRRSDLLRQIGEQQAELDRSATGRNVSAFQQRACSLLTSPAVRQAFDIAAEPPEMRERYGMNIHGQCVLMARRLVERGVPFVSVNWHNDGHAFWDTHGNNFNRLKNDLCPPADQALSALLDDLTERNLLDQTIIAWVGEFGRAPIINKANAGREHHPFCYSGALAGGGIRGGTVYGASDAVGHYPAEDPVSQHEYSATILHALGIPQDQVLHDRQSRPHRLYDAPPLLNLFS